MFTQCYLKNKKYIESARTYMDDYSNNVSKRVDMTMSGKYIGEYPNFNVNIKFFDKYPSHCIIKKLEEEIIRYLSLTKKVIIGSGSNGLLQNIIKILFRNGGNLVTPFYTFNQAEYAVSSFGGVTRRVIMNDVFIDFDNIYESIDNNTKMIYLCNPNNPTGIYVEINKLLKFIEKINKNILIVVDESSIEFTQNKSLLNFDFPDNVIVLRTFSKAYGLANLRVGYMVCSSSFQKIYKERITVNEVSGLSCDIALQAIRSENYKENIKKIIEYREDMIKKLKFLGITTYKSDSNTIMTSTVFDNDFIKRLELEDISVVLVKDINNEQHIRIAIQDKNTNNQFIEKFEKILKKNEI